MHGELCVTWSCRHGAGGFSRTPLACVVRISSLVFTLSVAYFLVPAWGILCRPGCERLGSALGMHAGYRDRANPISALACPAAESSAEPVTNARDSAGPQAKSCPWLGWGDEQCCAVRSSRAWGWHSGPEEAEGCWWPELGSAITHHLPQSSQPAARTVPGVQRCPFASRFSPHSPL